MVGMDSQANDATPDKIQSKGKCLPAERSLSEEQCEYECTACFVHLTFFPSPSMHDDVTRNQKTQGENLRL